MSKYGNIISQAKNQKAVKPENQKKGKPESKKTAKPELVDEDLKPVNLSIKVPANLRRHWGSKAKKEGTTITAEVTAALNKRFGTP